ncbi:hypothetical protein BSP38_219 [Bacillus phage BSP38]|uniref:Uncharacterized protein n=1 Tax=Bacillus phage BSP38 TaxID=2283013 RepID=A0A345MK79_BPBSP|nr:hypothetical protein HWB82_gp099 [Bacillus phage BSP38]AXH71261.1 hypothetical protein BSP38_219 [Bacillus phage BSP38]
MQAFRVTYNIGGSSGKQEVLLLQSYPPPTNEDLEHALSKKDPLFDPSFPFCKVTKKQELSMDQVKITDLSITEMQILFGL